MKYIVPQPDITLYEDGFEKHDLLDRTELSTQLSNLVERIEDPMVIALDGPWGSGKSVFLKCWVGQHLKDEKTKAEPVYFDAFRHDYADTPLLSLTQVIVERFLEPETAQPIVSDNAKKLFHKLKRPAMRVGLAAASAGLNVASAGLLPAAFQLSEVATAAANEAVSATSDEAQKALDKLWAQQTAQKDAMEQFRNTLEKLTKPKDEGGEAQKLVIAIDELDRCRPDYALSVLETIKHFFDVPNVHFVLGVNLEELANSVRARYGAGTDAQKYLAKFVNVGMLLPKRGSNGNLMGPEYFGKMAEKMEIDKERTRAALRCIDRSSFAETLTLRDIERILTKLALIPSKLANDPDYSVTIVTELAILNVVAPDAFKKAIEGRLEINDIYKAFNVRNTNDDEVDVSSEDGLITTQWMMIIDHEYNSPLGSNIPGHEQQESQLLLRRLCQKYLMKIRAFDADSADPEAST
ncbi:P-loop NTPase fold protein [Paracoccaceae bacterium GXU_MW_L88]